MSPSRVHPAPASPSLLYLLGLLDRPTKGEILINAIDTQHLSSSELSRIRLEKIGFVFQFHFLLPEFTVLDNVMIPMQKLGKLPQKQQVEHATGLLTDLGLEGISAIAALRNCQADKGNAWRWLGPWRIHRISSWRTSRREALISAATEQVFESLQKIVETQRTTVVAVTHDMDIASRMERRIHLVDGRVDYDNRQ